MAAKFAVDLKIGKLQEDVSIESLSYDARYYRNVFCPDLDEKRPIAVIYINHINSQVEYQPEVVNSTVELEICGCEEQALGAIAQAIGLD